MDAAAASRKPQRPFLKWAGNKFRILAHIKKCLPPGQRLIEPFAGSAAVFLNTDFEVSLLNDTNPDLIGLFEILKLEGPKFIRYCERLFDAQHNDSDSYYQIRDKFNHSNNARQRAAQFIYLNRHGYNGLCRYNASGGFNVPFGRYKRPYFPHKELLAFHHKAQRAEFRVKSFEETFQQARAGDVIYCDPPYVPLSDSANFTTYSAGGFDLDKQQQLVELTEQTSQRGIPVLVSNHDTPFTRKIYRNATRLDKFQVQRSISCKGEKRQHAGELLALYS